MITYNYGVELHSIDSVPPEVLRMWRNDPETRAWCREYREITKDMQNRWLTSLDHQSNLMFSIYVPSSLEGFYVGACGLTGIHPTHRSGEFSIYVGKEFRRQGYARKALQTLIMYGFKEVNLHRIWGETFEENPGRRLYDKLGFFQEGMHKDTYYKNGEYINSYTYAMLSYDTRPWEYKQKD